jgi:hypothetical protein
MFLIYFYSSYTSKSYKDYTLCFSSMCLLNGSKIIFDGFTTSIYLDTSYNYLQRSNRFISSLYDREFDVEPNGFTLQQFSLSISKQPEQGFGGLINLIIGRDANYITTYGTNPNVGSQVIGADFYQAYGQYKFGNSTLIFGQFQGLAGVESIDPNANTHFSHSILDYLAIPGVLLGVRETYSIQDKILLNVGLNNGWDNIRDTSRQKTLELGVTYTPISSFSFTADIYTGEERGTPLTSSGPEGRRSLLDLAMRWDATPKLNFAVAADYGIQSQAALPYHANGIGLAVWKGIAGYLNYKFTPKWEGAVRAELFEDPNGFLTGVRQNWRELTLTLGYNVTKKFIVRAETRHDFSNVNAFRNKNGIGAGTSQQSYAIEGIYNL